MTAYSSLGPRKQPLGRGVPLGRTVPLLPSTPLAREVPLQAYAGLQRYQPIRPVSDRRRAENRERAAMAGRLWPDRRDGTVMCAVPWCDRRADDLHEPLTRARGGSITDEENAEPVCRQHNDELTLEPQWGYDLRFLRHSWDAKGGAA